MRIIFPISLLAFSCILAGCRQAERLAWTADARRVSLAGWNGPRAAATGEAARLQAGLTEYLSGLLAEGRGEMEAARAHYEMARDKDPRSAQIPLRLGILHLRNNEMDPAARTLEEASRKNPEDPRPRFVLGVMYMDQGRLEEASEQYSQVLNQDPKNLGALSQLADLYVLQEKLQEGLVVYEQLLEERPDSSIAHFNVGVLYAKGRDWERAVGHLAKAVELDSNFLEARLGLAVALEFAGRLEEAKQQFMAAVSQEPVNTQLIHYLAQLSYRLGDFEESARWLTRYLSFKPFEPAAQIELATVRIEQGRWEEAAGLLQRVMDPESPPEGQSELWTALGMAYQAGRKQAAAEEAYLQAIRLAPEEEFRPVLQLAGLFQRQGRFEEAERLLQGVFERTPDDPALLNSLGFLYADWGVHLEEAVNLLERALRQDPSNGAYLDSLGWAYFKLGHPEEALRLLEQAAERTPEQEVFDHLGQVYLKLGKEQEALSAWKKGLELESRDPEITDRLESHIRTFSGKRKER